MKRFFALLIGALFLIGGVQPAHASSTIALTEPTHRLMDGSFIDDELATALSPSGRLGKLIYPPNYSYLRSRDWYIDPALIADVQAMTAPYKLVDGSTGSGRDVALAWLSRLHAVVASGAIYPIAEGNPSEYWVKRLTPHDRNFLLRSAQLSLSTSLGGAGANQNVMESKSYFSTRYFSLTNGELRAIADTNSAIQKYATLMSAEELQLFRGAVQKVLNPDLSVERRALLFGDLATHVETLNNTIHLVPGKFTMTSSKQNLPVTVVNGFEKPVRVNLLIDSTNQRILVTDQKNILVGARAKVQVMVPVRVVASGSTGLDVQLTSERGVRLAPEVIYPVSVTVISPIATWITTGAALVLFFAALVRSIRRLRRKNFRGE